MQSLGPKSMAHNQHAQHRRQHEGDDERHPVIKKGKTSPQLLILIISLASCSLLFVHRFLSMSSLHLPYIFSGQYARTNSDSNDNAPCASAADNTICCDRTSYHSDVCFMVGDVRTHSPSSSVLLLHSPTTPSSIPPPPDQKIRPYTRKWESAIRDHVGELRLRFARPNAAAACDVRHDVPALFFSAGGYTGNVFHAFNNGILPLYITSHHLNRQVVLVVLNYRDWWYTKYREILSQISDYPPIDFSNDTRTHCFPRAIVGLRFHGTLSLDPKQMKSNKTIADFQELLDKAYYYSTEEKGTKTKPKLVIVSRIGTRAILNEGAVAELGKKLGFEVELLRPDNTMSMARIYRALSSCDVMIGVHGSALTHFLFMRPGSVFIQIVPLGIDALARSCFGEAAVKMGLRYEEYKIAPRESSLYGKYGEGDPVVRDPESVEARGWEVVKELYLEGQNLTLDLGRINERLASAFQYVSSKRMRNRTADLGKG